MSAYVTNWYIQAAPRLDATADRIAVGQPAARELLEHVELLIDLRRARGGADAGDFLPLVLHVLDFTALTVGSRLGDEIRDRIERIQRSGARYGVEVRIGGAS